MLVLLDPEHAQAAEVTSGLHVLAHSWYNGPTIPVQLVGPVHTQSDRVIAKRWQPHHMKLDTTHFMSAVQLAAAGLDPAAILKQMLWEPRSIFVFSE